MKKNLYTAFIPALILLSISWNNNSYAGELPRLFYEIPDSIQDNLRQSTQKDRTRIAVDFSIIDPSSRPIKKMRAKLPGKEIIIEKETIETRGDGDYTWSGRVRGKRLSSVVMSVADGYMYGFIDIEGETFTVEPDNGSYLVLKEDSSKAIPMCDGQIIPKINNNNALSNLRKRAQLDSGNKVDVLVLYTKKIKSTYKSKLKSLIQNFVDISNSAYKKSGIKTRLRLAGRELYDDVNAREGVSIENSVNYITLNNSEVSELRNKYKADLVCLMRKYKGSGNCGRGWMMTSINDDFSAYGYSVIEVKNSRNGYYCDKRTFAHELGHNFGCAHDRLNATSQGVYAYSYGYSYKKKYGTIMSYVRPTITFFSTPLKKYKGRAVGKPESSLKPADNARTINNTRGKVANFIIKNPE